MNLAEREVEKVTFKENNLKIQDCKIGICFIFVFIAENETVLAFIFSRSCTP